MQPNLNTLRAASFCVLHGLTIFVLVMLPSKQLFAASCESVARIVSLEGSIEYKTANTEHWNPAVLEQDFCSGDALRSGRDGRAALRMINDTLLRLDHSTAIIFTSVAQKERSFLDLLKGALHFISRVPRSLEVNTPYLNAAIEGTEFVIQVKQDSAEVTVYEGKVVASNASGSVDLISNQTGAAASGQAPVRIVVAHPRDAVAWALYYPPLPVQADQAGELAHQTIDAIVKNDIEWASTLARQAIADNPQSAAAFMAQSYVDQARFDIPAALEHSRRAAELAPQDAITQARLAEVLLMTGDTKAAKAIAENAVQLDPSLAHTQTVLGFSSLRAVNLDDAESAFNQAIRLDSATPLPRLGIGLVKIRRGDLKAGREEIETAALLDPNNALLRSYMGKAYYEEKRGTLASEQFAMAKELDPNDPTAWFYDSILLLSENRPVEALQAQQQAIALNDNRGVYRSRQLLDQDEAARNTASARIYSDLGFEKLAIVEGAKALAHAPDNFSAHRFLADINSTQPQRNLAVESDLLQSKLLQPLTLHSLRPQLSDLQLADGPARFSYNEFNPLFTTSGPSLFVDGFVAENNTWGEDVIVSYLHDRFSINLGQYHYESDGFREFDSLEKDTLTAFLQFDATPDTMLQIEYSDDEQQNGDLNQHFFTDLFARPGLKVESEIENVRLGFRHSISPTSVVLGNIYESDQLSVQSLPNNFDGLPDNPINNVFDLRDAEFQWIKNSDYIKTTIGASATQIDINTLITFNFPGFLFGLPDPIVQSIFDNKSEQLFYSLYFYSNLSTNDKLDLTLGLSYTRFEETVDSNFSDPILGNGNDKSQTKEDQLNPKLGLTWNIGSSTTLRAAAFRDSRKDPNDATLEPTQVAGFNQVFNDYESSATKDSKRYGIAVDHNIKGNLFAGISYLHSDLDSIIIALNREDSVFESTRKLAEAYLYYSISSKFSIKIDYDYEEYEEPVEAATGILSLKTHRVPIGFNYFNSSRLSAGLSATYYNQKGLFVDFSNIGQPEIRGEDEFWLIDVSLTYNLPNRRGEISIGAKNIFDSSFQYEDRVNNTLNVSPDQSTNFFELSPEQVLYGKVSLLF